MIAVTTQTFGSTPASPAAPPAAAPAAGTSPPAYGPAVLTDLSAAAGPLRAETFDEMVTRRTEAFAATLSGAFEAAQIRIEDAMALRVDRYGGITADGPQKDKIEKLMRDNPDLAEEFRTIATLNAMRAAAEALRVHAEETKAARNPKEKRAADDRYAGHAAAIHSLSGSLTLKGDRLVSAAMVYARSLSDPGGDVAAVRSQWEDRRTDFLV